MSDNPAHLNYSSRSLSFTLKRLQTKREHFIESPKNRLSSTEKGIFLFIICSLCSLMEIPVETTDTFSCSLCSGQLKFLSKIAGTFVVVVFSVFLFPFVAITMYSPHTLGIWVFFFCFFWQTPYPEYMVAMGMLHSWDKVY